VDDAPACDVKPARVDRGRLRREVQSKYTAVANEPEQGFHFHTGWRLARMLGYSEEEVNELPAATVESFAGTGNPFSAGPLGRGERVLDLGCGAGFDTLLAARQVGPEGQVVGIDMTEAMLAKARASVEALGLGNVDLRLGYAEELPLESGAVDVVISNGVINLCPDKRAVLRELRRVLRPGGRLQIADIVVHRPVPQDAKEDIDLWSG
jgi:SAM-dependent methyltransferase